MASRAANVATIPASVGFVDALAVGILEAHGGTDPMALTALTVLMPTRRAVRSLSEAFLRASRTGTLLLPAIRAIGDVDEDELALADAGETQGDPLLDDGLALPYPISGLRRQLLLALQIQTRWAAERAAGRRAGGGLEQAARLAADLAGLLDAYQFRAEAHYFGRRDLKAAIRDLEEVLRAAPPDWPDRANVEAFLQTLKAGAPGPDQ